MNVANMCIVQAASSRSVAEPTSSCGAVEGDCSQLFALALISRCTAPPMDFGDIEQAMQRGGYGSYGSLPLGHANWQLRARSRLDKGIA